MQNIKNISSCEYTDSTQTQTSETHPDVEAQQVADHSRHGGQDDDPGDVVDQRVHSQTQQSERSIQLLEQVRAQANQVHELQRAVG